MLRRPPDFGGSFYLTSEFTEGDAVGATLVGCPASPEAGLGHIPCRFSMNPYRPEFF
ncbi:hypothetical protein LV83_03582 [Algoriphagus yeomjeoni]|uniref:Uncharacterized protein n=1 Tax=Algoriphagus yeomjeoni TaxID=291403 RepID=A0A327P7C3_9BACT|nr:hypothetical protein LV83_03582 [Algoriphagus yeomjeoni]